MTRYVMNDLPMINVSFAVVIITLQLFGTTDSCGPIGTRCIELQPENLDTIEGNTVQLTCILSCNWTGDISFGVLRYNTYERIHRGEILQLTNRSAQLVLTNVSVAVDDNLKFYCTSNRTDSECTSLRVFRQPLTPFFNRCVVSNWQTMTCTWTPNGATQRQHTNDWNVITTIESCLLRDETSENSCPSTSTKSLLHNDEFVWNNPTLDAVYCMRTRVTLTLANSIVQSNWTCIKPSQYVRPQPPNNISHVIQNVTHVIIKWRLEFPREFRPSMTYRITLTSDLPPDELVVTEVTDADRVTLPVLRPHTTHRVCIQAKPTHSGYWSICNFPYEFESLPTVPCRQPQVVPHVFHKQSHSVVLYWKPVPAAYQCGANFSYLVAVVQPNNSRQLPGIQVSANVTTVVLSAGSLGPSSSVEILSRNGQGTNHTNNSINVILEDSELDQNQPKVSAEGINKTVTIHVMFAKTRRHLSCNMTLITVYWCLMGTQPYTCTDDIQWLQVSDALLSAADDEYSYSLNALPDEFRRYQVGVAVNNGSLQWASCIHTMNGSIFPPSDVALIAVTSVTSVTSGDFFHGRLQLKWSESDCKQTSGLVTSYLINYCAVDDNFKCIGNEIGISEPASKTVGTSYTLILSGLDPDTLYGVEIVSCSRSSRSLGSSIVVARTSFGLTVGYFTIVVTSALIIFVLGLIAICCLQRWWQRYRRKHKHDFDITVPDDARKTMRTYCDPQHDESANSRIQGVSLDSGYHDTLIMSPLLTINGCNRQFSDHSLDSEVFAENGITNSPSIASDVVSDYVRLSDIISLHVGSTIGEPSIEPPAGLSDAQLSTTTVGDNNNCYPLPRTIMYQKSDMRELCRADRYSPAHNNEAPVYKEQ